MKRLLSYPLLKGHSAGCPKLLLSVFFAKGAFGQISKASVDADALNIFTDLIKCIKDSDKAFKVPKPEEMRLKCFVKASKCIR